MPPGLRDEKMPMLRQRRRRTSSMRMVLRVSVYQKVLGNDLKQNCDEKDYGLVAVVGTTSKVAQGCLQKRGHT